MKKLLLLIPLLLPLAACSNETQVIDEVITETSEEALDVDAFVRLANEEALVKTDDKEYFTDGTIVENHGDTVVIKTPYEPVIMDSEGSIKVSDLELNPEKQNLIYRNGRILIQEVLGDFDPDDYPDNVQVVRAKENLIDVSRSDDIRYKEEEYSKKSYEKAFNKRSVFIEDATDSRELMERALNKKIDSVMSKLREERNSQLLEEGKQQASIEASIEASVQASLEATTEHVHNFQPVYNIVYHDAVTEPETYYVTEEVPVTKYEVYDKNTREVILTTDTEKEAVDSLDENTAYRSVTKTEKKTVQKTKMVTVKEGYREQIIDHYECSCGAKELGEK